MVRGYSKVRGCSASGFCSSRYTPLLHPLLHPLNTPPYLRLLLVTRAAPVRIEGDHIVRRVAVDVEHEGGTLARLEGGAHLVRGE